MLSGKYLVIAGLNVFENSLEITSKNQKQSSRGVLNTGKFRNYRQWSSLLVKQHVFNVKIY